MAIEIVDLPIQFVIFHSFLYVYQRVISLIPIWLVISVLSIIPRIFAGEISIL